ncbi:hypothetical protein Hanom_Chr06g00531161 [Helianthus anomalus]
MICKIKGPNYVAPENDARKHENINSEDETDSLSGRHEKRLRYWFVKDGKRKRTPKVSRRVVAPNVVIKGKFDRGSHIKEPTKKKSPPRLIDETVIPPADVIQGGVDLLKETLEDFLKKNDEAEAAKAAKINDLSKKVSSLEKAKAKAEVECDDLKKKLEKSLQMNEEMKLVVNDHAERVDALIEDLADNAKLIDQLLQSFQK